MSCTISKICKCSLTCHNMTAVIQVNLSLSRAVSTSSMWSRAQGGKMWTGFISYSRVPGLGTGAEIAQSVRRMREHDYHTLWMDMDLCGDGRGLSEGNKYPGIRLEWLKKTTRNLIQNMRDSNRVPPEYQSVTVTPTLLGCEVEKESIIE
jgi:hypothetical protein